MPALTAPLVLGRKSLCKSARVPKLRGTDSFIWCTDTHTATMQRRRKKCDISLQAGTSCKGSLRSVLVQNYFLKICILIFCDTCNKCRQLSLWFPLSLHFLSPCPHSLSNSSISPHFLIPFPFPHYLLCPHSLSISLFSPYLLTIWSPDRQRLCQPGSLYYRKSVENSSSSSSSSLFSETIDYIKRKQ